MQHSHLQEAVWSVRRNCSCIIVPCLPDAHRCMETKSSHMDLLVVFLIYLFFFFNGPRMSTKRWPFCPSQLLEVTFHFLVRVDWSPRLLEGKVTSSQTAILGNECLHVPSPGSKLSGSNVDRSEARGWGGRHARLRCGSLERQKGDQCGWVSQCEAGVSGRHCSISGKSPLLHA